LRLPSARLTPPSQVLTTLELRIPNSRWMKRDQRRRPRIHLNQPVRDSHRDGFVPIEDAELADYVAEVKIHRAFSDLELVADFGADHPASGQLQALAFACRERTSLLERRDTFFDDIRHENGMKHRSKIHDTRGNRRDDFPIARI